MKHTENILQNRTLICTYPEKDQDEVTELLTQQGATVLSLPMIEIHSLPVKAPQSISSYDWLIFTSKNAVESFHQSYPQVPCKIAALGERTAQRLRQFNYNPDFIGSGKSAHDFVDEFGNTLKTNEQVLLVLGTLAPDTLQQKLGTKAKIERVNAYQTQLTHEVGPKLKEIIENKAYSAMLVTSPSAVKSIVSLWDNSPPLLNFISIGKTTTAAIQALGMEPLATANDPSYRGLAEATINYFYTLEESKKN